MSQAAQYDSILIGTGQATGTMVRALLEMGQKLAVVENDRAGGTCLNWGCTPTKTIVASARAAHMARRGGDFGVRVSGIKVDFARVMERQNTIREMDSASLEKYLRQTTDYYAGTAVFVGANEVTVGETHLMGSTIYIHTGARAQVPDIRGIDTVPFLDNRGILALDTLPEHLVVIGGSYIGLEFSQAFRRFGSRVTVLQRGPRIMSREDADIAAEAQRLLEDEEIEILCNTAVVSVEPTDAGVAVKVDRGGTVNTIEGSHLLLATGRVPNTEALNLETAGVQINERGFVQVNDRLQTNVPHIYAVGDVNGLGAFTHTSVHDGQIIINNLRGGDWRTTDRNAVYAMFIDPPLGRVGMNEKQARASGRSVLQATMPMSRVNRAREKDETGGLIKILVDGDTKAILGATILGIGGDEIINVLAAWMVTGLPYTEFQRAVLVHPTVAELLPWVLERLEPLGD